MQRIQQFRSGAALLLLSSLVMAGCTGAGSAGSTGGASGGGSVVDIQNFAAGDPDHIDPALASDPQSAQIADLVYDGLTDTTTDGRLRNAVAEDVSPSEDARTWTFRLRPDVRFDNGDPVQASDFKFAWQRAADPKLASQVAYHMSSIEGFEAVASGQTKELTGVVADDAARMLTVRLSAPARDFAEHVSIPVFSPLPQRTFMATATNSAVPNSYERWEDGVMVGNGPFRMSRPWERGRSIALARNDGYYGGITAHKAYIDNLEFRISTGLDAAFAGFESGEAQVGRVPPGRYGELKASRGADVVDTPLLGTEYWAFNMRSPILGGPDNTKLRQAVALATNKSDVVDKVYAGARPVATKFTPPAMPGYDPEGAQEARDVSKAKDLLREWGKPVPTVKISFNAGAGHEEKAAILQQNLAEIGINAVPDPLDNQSYRRAMNSGALDMFRQNWTADYVSYDNFIAPVFSTASIGKDNTTGYSNPTVDGLVQQARSEKDLRARERLYRDAEKLVLQDQAVVPLAWSSAGLIKADNVEGLEVKPLGFVAYNEVRLRR